MDYSDVFLARIDEIERCLKAECYFAALSLALTLPDICGKAEYPRDNNGDRYKKWYNENIGVYEKSPSPYADGMPYLSGEVVWSLRCSFLHSGNPNIEVRNSFEDECKVDQFVIRYGTSLSGDTSHISYVPGQSVSYREYDMNIRPFCGKLLRAARGYYQENKEKFNFFNYVLEEENEKPVAPEQKEWAINAIVQMIANEATGGK